MSNLIENGICPTCNKSLVYPRNDYAYCEECGWPDEDFDGTYGYPEINEFLTEYNPLEFFNGSIWEEFDLDDARMRQTVSLRGYFRYKMK